MKARCQICGEWFAEVSTSFLSYPLTGAMFKSKDPFHDFPAPFPPHVTWEDFRCPYGNHRPLIKDDEIQTDQGLITLKKDGSSAHVPLPGAAPVFVDREIHIFTEQTTVEMAETMDRKNWSTERTVKKREPVKKSTKDVHVRSVREGIQDGKGKGRLRCESCGKEFDKEINLNRHKRMAHK